MPARRAPVRRKPVRAPKRRPRKVRNPRPIPLDDEAIERLTDRLYDQLRAKAERYGKEKVNPKGRAVGIAESEVTLRATSGRPVSIGVILTVAPSPSPVLVTGGGMGRRDGLPVVLVEMNGRYSWETLADEEMTRHKLRPTLRHELTHAVDVFSKTPSAVRKDGRAVDENLLRQDEAADLGAYYNHPGEVAAYLRQLYEEMRPNIASWMRSPQGRAQGLGVTLSRVLSVNDTWLEIEPYLTPRNRRRILSGLARAFKDDGF